MGSFLPNIIREKIRHTNLYISLSRRPFKEKSINIIHNKGIIFIHNPKTGGTSIKSMLKIPIDKADHKTPTYLVHRKTWEKYFSIVVVRNPFSRLVSSFSYHTNQKYQGYFYEKYPSLHSLDFDEYFDLMKHEPFVIAPQILYIKHKQSNKKADFICKFDRLNTDIPRLFNEVFNYEYNIETPHLNRSNHKDYRTYFTPSMRKRVEDFYSECLTYFGYQF